MRRELAAAIFTLSTLTSGLVEALGVGEAVVKSSLNQPLNAEIELLNVDGLSENEIVSALASREAFLRQDIDRTFFLSDLRFRVQKGSGRTYIEVTSSQPVREPYLNFLVEVNWPTGRLMREYALLIDPPVFSGNTGGGQTVREAASAPGSTTSSSGKSADTPAAQAAQGKSRPSTAGGGDRPRARSGAGAATYGPVDATDTLWSIAARTRPDTDVSVQQMMIAIQRANPDAFQNGNINNLLRDRTLQIPSENEIREVGHQEASTQVARQNQQFARDTAPPAGSRPSTSGTERLRVLSDEEVNVAGGQASPGSPSTATAGSSGGTALEDSSRASALASQVETLQRLVSLKDEQLAELQAELNAARQADNDSSSTGQVDQGSTAPAGQMASPAAMSGLRDDESFEADDPENEQDILTGDTEVDTDFAATSYADPAGVAEPSTPPVTVERPRMGKPVESAPEADANWLATVLSNPLYQIALAAGGLLLLFLLWLISKSNARKEENFLERHNRLGDDTQALDFERMSERSAAAAAEAREDATGGEENDPVEEAEVYLAYQRYDQATQVLDHAWSRNPSDLRIGLKLAEVAAHSGNKALFDRTADRLREHGDASVQAEVARLENELYGSDGDQQLTLDELESQLLGGKKSTAPSTASTKGTQTGTGAMAAGAAAAAAAGSLAGGMQRQTGKPAGASDELQDADLDKDDRLVVEDTEFFPGIGSAQSEDGRAGTAATKPDSAPGELEIDFDLGEMDDMDRHDSTDDIGTVAVTAPKADKYGESDENDLLADLPELDDDFLGSDDTARNLAADTDHSDAGSLDTLPDLDTSLDELDRELVGLEDELGQDSTAPATMDWDEIGLPADSEDLQDAPILDRSLDTDQQLSDEFIDAIQTPVDEQPLDLDFTRENDSLSAELPDAAARSAIDEDSHEAVHDRTSQRDTQPEAGELDALDALDALDGPGAMASAPDGASAAQSESMDGRTAESSSPDGTADKPLRQQDDMIDDLEDDFDFLAGTDEAATKLDLARAYIDMGDSEGARDILEEVVEEGSPEQQDEARKLLGGLS